MELKYPYIILIGLAAAVIMLILHLVFRKKKRAYTKGEKIYNMAFMKDNKYLKWRKFLYRFLSVVMLLTLAVCMVSVSVMAARPFKSSVENKNKYSRDIILCMDISTTVDDMNANLLDEMIELVRTLKGERFGIIIFNTSPVLICPLTDDYEYVIEQLENVQKGLEQRLNFDYGYWINDDAWNDYIYWTNYISAGTLIGNESRGSSLIGDGLASTVYNFSKKDTDRTKLVIFTTDNDVNGEEIYDLPEAAELCLQNGITVYGIGTKAMRSSDKKEMQSAVELTGGKFYLEENKDSFDKIVDDIESHSSSLIRGETYITETEYPEKAFIVSLVSMILMFMSICILKK